ncbi:MAG: hypothetical protein ABSG02_07530 [Terriglobales bacterium]|jgi:hypothetical protein
MALENAATQRAGVGFAVGRQAGPVVIEVRLHHDTISILKGVQVSFELLNGLSVDQARKIADMLGENVVGIRVVAAGEGKAEAASG